MDKVTSNATSDNTGGGDVQPPKTAAIIVGLYDT
jgi:hypothetical protein